MSNSTLQQEFRTLLELGTYLSIFFRGRDCSEVEELISTFFKKQIMHGYTVWQIINPQPIEIRTPAKLIFQEQFSFIDFSSLNVIIRVMFELDVAMQELLLQYNNSPREELDFKITMWYLHGLCEKRRVVSAINSTSRPEFDELENEINNLIRKVKSLPYFKSLPKEQQQSIKDKLGNRAENYVNSVFANKSLVDKAKEMGYSNYIAESLHKFCSSYVHTEAYAFYQIGAVHESEEALRLSQSNIKYASMLMASSINAFKNTVSDYQSLITSNKEIENLLLFFEHMKKNLE